MGRLIVDELGTATTRDVGDGVDVRWTTRDASGDLTSATVTLTVTDPSSATTTPAVTETSTGTYDASFTLDSAGVWHLTWAASGALTLVSYGQITAVDPAPGAYADLDELRHARRISDATDTTDDVVLLKALMRASRAIDRRTGRQPGGFFADTATSARTYDPRGRTVAESSGERLLIDEVSTATGLVVETGSAGSSTWTAVGSTGYEAGPLNAIARLEPIRSVLRVGGLWWTSGSSRVRITARWGWPQVPAPIEEATLLLANRRFMRRESPEGVAGLSDQGPVRISRFDPDIEDLVGPYMLPGFA